MADIYRFRQWSLTLLRVVLGLIFTYHGYLKLFVKGNLLGTAAFFAQVGIPLANFSAVLVAFVELIGGIFLLLGFLAKWTSIVLMIEMLVALFAVHFKKGFLIAYNGFEFVLLIVLTLAIILFNGPGTLSLDRVVFGIKEESGAARKVGKKHESVEVRGISGSGTIARTGIKKEPGYLYFLDGKGDIARVQMARKGKRTSKKHEVVLKVGVQRREGYLYYIDRNGNICQAKMARG